MTDWQALGVLFLVILFIVIVSYIAAKLSKTSGPGGDYPDSW